jgi:hypothetical protein
MQAGDEYFSEKNKNLRQRHCDGWSNKCPCCIIHVETAEHILLCPEEGRIEAFRLAMTVDSQESLTGEDRPELSGTIKEVTKRNNTDHILDRLINWQYLLPPIKLFYILT